MLVDGDGYLVRISCSHVLNYTSVTTAVDTDKISSKKISLEAVAKAELLLRGL